MFCRTFLVTNSSTCSCVYFGFRLDTTQILKLLAELWAHNTREFRITVRNKWTNQESDVTNATPVGEVVRLFQDSHEWSREDIIHQALPEGLACAIAINDGYIVYSAGRRSRDFDFAEIPIDPANYDALTNVVDILGPMKPAIYSYEEDC
jgi:hypothetical protein